MRIKHNKHRNKHNKNNTKRSYFKQLCLTVFSYFFPKQVILVFWILKLRIDVFFNRQKCVCLKNTIVFVVALGFTVVVFWLRKKERIVFHCHGFHKKKYEYVLFVDNGDYCCCYLIFVCFFCWFALFFGDKQSIISTPRQNNMPTFLDVKKKPLLFCLVCFKLAQNKCTQEHTNKYKQTKIKSIQCGPIFIKKTDDSNTISYTWQMMNPLCRMIIHTKKKRLDFRLKKHIKEISFDI